MTGAVPERLRALALRCPACRSHDLACSAHAIECASCGTRYDRRGDQLRFVDSAERAGDPLDRLKRPLKRFRRIYAALVALVSPLYFDGTRRRFLARHVRGRPGLFLNVGAGNTIVDPRVINLDATAYDGVDVVCDAADLPIADASVDVVLNVSVLEHVPDPARVLGEIRRVLRPGGRVYTDVPFVVGYHASPGDYTRWTHEGVLALHREFVTESLVLNGGPTSALLWVLQEWIAVTLSFGSRRLHTAVYLAAMLATFPLKFLDAGLKHLPHARHISSCFIYVGRKPAPPA